ncbi:MAG: DUF4124 domain-containing protein [Gammaproteobacteria bacterium]
MRCGYHYILSICAGLVFANNAVSVTVHTWKDADGVTHFSDAPSPTGIESETLNFDALEDKKKQDVDDFYSIANQWQRLRAERDAARALREAKEQRRAAEADRRAAIDLQQAAQSSNDQNYPVYGPIIGGGLLGSPGYPGRYAGRRHHDRRQRGIAPYVDGQRHPYNDGHRRQARVNPNYHSPFHDRVQPQSIRPKSFPNRRSAFRGNQLGARGSFFVQF